MTRIEQRLSDLERMVAEQAAEIEDLRAEAFVLRTLEEMMVRQCAGGSAPAVPPRRRGHLRLVGGLS
jgi:hypothetical protein